MNKNTIFAIFAVIIIVLGGWFYLASKIEAPTEPNLPDNKNPNDLTTPYVPSPSEISLKTVTVTGVNFAFEPSEIRVKKGDTVRVTFKSTMGMHDFKIDEFAAATKVLRATDAEEIIEFIADKTGEFEYYCSVGSHRANGMVGKLIVTE